MVVSGGKNNLIATEDDCSAGFESVLGNIKTILLANPRGFCAGVDRAIQIVELALERFGSPMYVKHAIVHNRHVVEQLEKMGAVFVEELTEVPEGARVVFSAHGVPPSAYEQAKQRSLEVLDATCPLVTKVHNKARHYSAQQRTIFLVGHEDHVEVVGTRGVAPEHIVVVGDIQAAEQVQAVDPEQVVYLTQTTLSLDDTHEILQVLKRRFPVLRSPRKDDICYATQNRQNAVKHLSLSAEVVFVVGSTNSSNSNRLVEVARRDGVPAYLVESHHDIKLAWLKNVQVVGITAGASAPEDVVQKMVVWFSSVHHPRVEELTLTQENVSFPLPASLEPKSSEHLKTSKYALI